MSETTLPRVLVFMATYNGEAHVAGQIDSILAQEGVTVDLHISDDRSSDGTGAVCERYAKAHPNVAFRRNKENKGAAWNFMDMVFEADPFAHDYFAFADQDDYWHPPKLARAIERLQATGAALYYSGLREVDLATGASAPSNARYFVGCEQNFGALLGLNWAAGCTMVFTPALLCRLQRYRPAEIPRYHDDWVHQVALSTMSTAPDLETALIDHQRTGANVSGKTDFNHASLKRLRRLLSFVGKPTKESSRAARELLCGFGELMHPQAREIATLAAATSTSVGARLKAVADPRFAFPVFQENLLLQCRILFGYF